MDMNGEIKISPKYKFSDYKALNLNYNSPEKDLDIAIEIFDDRINGWYFKAIEKLLDIEINDKDINISEKSVLNFGFASMAIMCLLIETLYQFETGSNKTPPNNKDEYAEFLTRNLSSIFDTKDKAKAFYSNIRCGILHSAETTEKSTLNTGKKVEMYSKRKLEVGVIGIYNELHSYFENYKKQIKSDLDMKKNFIDKMEHIYKNAINF